MCIARQRSVRAIHGLRRAVTVALKTGGSPANAIGIDRNEWRDGAGAAALLSNLTDATRNAALTQAAGDVACRRLRHARDQPRRSHRVAHVAGAASGGGQRLGDRREPPGPHPEDPGRAVFPATRRRHSLAASR